MTAPPPAGLVAGTIAFSSVDGPGNRFVVFLQGCDFDCLACHNPHTIPDVAAEARRTTVDELLAMLRGPAPFLSGVTVSGGEATRQAPFVRALFTALRDDERLGRLTRFVDSHGGVPDRVWDDLEPVMDAAMIDLKALDDETHRFLTGRPNELVLRSIRRLAASGRLHEVRLLLVPGLNDAADALARTAAWLHGVDPAMRVQLTAFRRHGVRAPARGWREPTADEMAGHAEVLRSAGLERVVIV